MYVLPISKIVKSVFDVKLSFQRTEQFLDGLYDENETDKSGKGFLSESGEVSDDSGKVESNDDEAEQGGPQSDPESHGEVVDLEVMTEVHEDLLEDEDWASTAEYRERLPSEETEHSASNEVTQERLQHSLETFSDVAEEAPESDSFCDGGEVDVDDRGESLS